MTMRVLYSDPGTSRDLGLNPFEELGRVDDGVWIACPDQTVKALAALRSPRFLYFDQGQYNRAVANLSPTQTQDVIRRRRDWWSAQAMNFAIYRLFCLERAALEGALRMRGGKAHADKALALLQKLSGLERYAPVPSKALAATALEGESLVQAAIASALGTDILDRESISVLSAHLERRKLWTRALAEVAVGLGAYQFANSLPYADVARGVLLEHPSAGFEEKFSKTGEPVVRWRDALAIVSPERHFESLRARAASLQILYADSGEFYDSVGELTTAQLHRDFALRLDRSKRDASRDFLGHIDRLHLHQLLIKCELRGRGDAVQVWQTAGMEAAFAEETEALGRALSRTLTFSSSEGLDLLESGALLQSAENLVDENLALFTGVCQRYAPAIAPSLKDISVLKGGASSAPGGTTALD